MLDSDGRELEEDVFEYLPESYRKRREVLLYFPLVRLMAGIARAVIVPSILF